MILHGSYTSPYVRHCRIVLDQSGLQWSFQDTDYAGSAAGSPAMRVPFLVDDGIQLNDSASILMHLAQKQGESFIQDAHEMEQFAMVNTAMDSAINLFLLERDGLTPDNSDYLARQANRIEALLLALNEEQWSEKPPFNTAEVRLGCFLDWALFRQRIDIGGQPNLQSFLSAIRHWPAFAATAPS